MGGAKLKALIVDDEDIIRDFLSRLLNLHNLSVQAVPDGFAAVKAAKKERFDIVFIDVRMPKIDGLETLKELKKVISGAKFVMMTGYAVDGLLKDSEQEGAAASIKKPFEIGEIISQIEEVKRLKAAMPT